MGFTDLSLSTDLAQNFEEQILFLSQNFPGKLHEKSLQFFKKIWEQQPSVLSKLPAKLKKNSLKLKSKITAQHLNRVIFSLDLQQQLTTKIFTALDHYIIDVKNQSHLGKLHKLAHEFSTASLIAQTFNVCDCLSILKEATPYHQFLRSLIQVMIYLNEQTLLPEHQRHESIVRKVVALLGISDSSDLLKLVTLLSDRIILATTTIHSHVRSINLNEVFFVLQALYQPSALQTSHDEFFKDLDVMMLALSVCKKRPFVIYDVLVSQQTNILKELPDYFTSPLCLEVYFRSGFFSAYFKQDAKEKINRQAFLLSMSQTLSYEAMSKYDNRSILAFIQICQKQRTKYKNKNDFTRWYKLAFSAQKIQHRLQRLLFDQMSNYNDNQLSDIGSLIFSANKLITLGYSPRSTHVASLGLFQPLIDANIIHTDVKNRHGFKDFYFTLTSTEQIQLLQELLLIIAFNTSNIMLNPPAIISQPLKRISSNTNMSLYTTSSHSKTYNGLFFYQKESVNPVIGQDNEDSNQHTNIH